MRRLTLLLVSTLPIISGATIAPALPEMARVFSHEADIELRVRLMLTLPALMTAISAPLAGLVIDRFGRRKLLIAVTLLDGVAGIAGGLTDSLTLILVSRALLGVAAGGILTTATTLIGDYYEDAKRRAVMGQQGTFAAFGGVLFVLIGGMLAAIHWRAPFGVFILGLVFLPLVIVFIKEPEVRRAIDPEAGASARVPAGFVAGLYVVVFVTALISYVIPVEMPFYLPTLGETSIARAGIAIAVFAFAGGLSAMQYAAVRKRVSFLGVLLIVFTGIGTGYLLVASASSYAVILGGLAVTGLGFGLFLPNMNVWAITVVPPQVRGKVMGGLTTCLFLGQFSSPLFSHPLAERFGIAGVFVAGAVVMGLFALLVVVRQLTERTA